MDVKHWILHWSILESASQILGEAVKNVTGHLHILFMTPLMQYTFASYKTLMNLWETNCNLQVFFAKQQVPFL